MFDSILSNWLLILEIAGGAFALAATVFSVLYFVRRRRAFAADKYLVRGMSKEHRALLTNQSVPFDTRHPGDLEEATVFAAKNLKRALKVLNARVITHYASSRSGEKELVLSYQLKKDDSLVQKHSVTIVGDVPCDRKRLLQVVRDEMLPHVQKDIVVHAVSEVYEATPDGKFHLVVHSAPGGSGFQSNPNSIWSMPVSLKGRPFNPSANGFPLVDEATGFTVAELSHDGDFLYLHADVLEVYARRGFFASLAHKFNKFGWHQPLGLLLRILQRAKAESDPAVYIRDTMEKLKADGHVPNETAQPATVSFDGINASRAKTVVESLVNQILVPATGVNEVHVMNCYGQTRSPLADTNKILRIYLQSAPMGQKLLDAPEKLFGLKLLRREKTYAPSPMGVPILDDNGNCIGELVENSLYLHHNVIVSGSRVDTRLLGRILAEVAKVFKTRASHGVEGAVSLQFEDECLRQYAAAQGKGAVRQDEVRSAQATMHSALEAARKAQQELYRLESAPHAELGKEFDALCSIPKVKDVKVTGDAVVVYTDLIFCRDPRSGVLHEIGAFEISIPTNTQGQVRWINKTRRVTSSRQGMNAPHVSEEGYACLGNMKDVFPAFIARRDFASAVEAAIAFVEAVNVDDSWGKYVNAWPVATQQHRP